jgi:CheY-like chemotaxis protein
MVQRMSISNSIEPHLPYLRRFARALSGSQDVGDRLVTNLLEALVADPKGFPDAAAPRVGLYKAFLRVWSKGPEQASAQGVKRSPADRNLAELTPLSRQAFLLLAVEGFSRQEAASILDVTEEELSALSRELARELAEQVATDILIIEDEPLIAMDLADLVQRLGHRVTATARTHDEAVAAVRQHKPGLVLADIQLADGSSGLDAVNEILASISVPVIFVTAFPERLLTGRRPEPAFLITKPFEPEALKAIISQALFFETRSVLAPLQT